MNPSDCPIELTANQILAEFIPVSELASPSPNHYNKFTVCTAMEGHREHAPETLTELTTAINPNLPARDKKAVPYFPFLVSFITVLATHQLLYTMLIQVTLLLFDNTSDACHTTTEQRLRNR